MVMGKGKDTRKTNSHAHATSLYLNFANKHSAAAVLYPKFSDTSKPASKQSSRNSEAYHRASSKQRHRANNKRHIREPKMGTKLERMAQFRESIYERESVQQE